MLRFAWVVVGAVVVVAGAGACGTVQRPSAAPIQSGLTSVASGPASAPAPSEVPSAPASVIASPSASLPVKPYAALTSTPPQDVGDLEQFTQVSATTWWASVVGDRINETFVVRTVDGGRDWQDITPAVAALRTNNDPISDVLSAETAWLGAATEDPSAPIPLYRTRDGGQSWQQVGTLPRDCALMFVDLSNGWCYSLQGAMGSMGVEIYRTEDGGSTWQLISETTGDGTAGTPGALPFGCDKSLTFTSQTVGWAASFCAGGGPYLDISTDGGARWHAVTPPPFPASADSSEGEGLGVPVASGEDVAVPDLGGLGPGASAIDTSSDGGRSWRIHPLPAPPAGRYWNVDLIDPTHWRATDGDVIISTDDAGMHWKRWTPAIGMHDQYGTLELDFISTEIGTASDPADRYPLWSTTDGGNTWTKVVIDAGPYVLN